MTRAEVAAILKLVVASYPNYDKFRDKTEVANTVNLWAVMFADDDRDMVTLAVKKHIATNKWPPSIAEIREIIAQIQHPELIPPDVAWSAVSDLMYAEGQFYDGDLYRRLPPLIARTVETIGYHTLWEMRRGHYGGSKAGMDRVTFIQQYTPAYERARSEAMTPAAINSEMAASRNALNSPAQKMLADVRRDRKEKERFYNELDEKAFLALPEGKGA